MTWLALRGSKEKLSLADSASALTPEFRKRLSELAKSGVIVAITGRPSDRKDAPSTLSVLRHCDSTQEHQRKNPLPRIPQDGVEDGEICDWNSLLNARRGMHEGTLA